ncbi:MAG: serine--tRNA ligase [Frankia sp.]
MIDLRIVRDQPDRVRESQRVRGADPGAVDVLLTADDRRRSAVSRADALRAEANAASRAIRSATKDDRPGLIVKATELKDEVQRAQSEQSEAEAALRAAQFAVDNIVDDAAPRGGEDDFVVLETVGEPPVFDGWEPADHLTLGERLRAIDVERGAKVSGSRFYFLTGVGALLELALVNLAITQAVEAGLTPVIPPALVKPSAMEGTGYLGAHASEVYQLPADDLYLVGTSEVPLAAFHSDEILDGASLPLRYAAYSPCYRREAGSYGKDTRGIFRVHWFDKVEMFSFVAPADAEAEHRRLLERERAFLDALELPYRVVDIATGDLGASAIRKFDCEAWMPSQGRYREVTSTSNCTTFQARRLNIRHRSADGVAPVATLNGTLCAVTRTIIAILENHQRQDGSVVVPAALRPHLGGREVLEPVAVRRG